MPHKHSPAKLKERRANRRLEKGSPRERTRSSFPNFWWWARWRRPKDTKALSNEEAIKTAERRVKNGRE